jgi:hypothetical protein
MTRFPTYRLVYAAESCLATLIRSAAMVGIVAIATGGAQAPARYGARTDRLLQPQTQMSPPPANTVFLDPDFSSRMIRVTDSTVGSLKISFRNTSQGDSNMWSSDGKKFFVVRRDGISFVFSFDPVSMNVQQLGTLPLAYDPSFSYVDPDLVYGIQPQTPLVISAYRISTKHVTTVLDTHACQTQPALSATAYGVLPTVSSDDSRIAVTEGGPTIGQHMFVTIYDRSLGCRWLNTQTGQIGGFGQTGFIANWPSFLVRTSVLSHDGRFLQITTNAAPFAQYIWAIDTLSVFQCSTVYGPHCGGYTALGNEHMVNQPGVTDEMNIYLRPLSSPAMTSQLVVPLKTPDQFGMIERWSWNNVDANDSVPVCGTTYRYNAYGAIQTVWDGEIICLETDGLGSTVWRFAHHRSIAETGNMQSMPLGNISPTGSFYLFTSNWGEQLGTEADGTTPRSDTWIAELK